MQKICIFSESLTTNAPMDVEVSNNHVKFIKILDLK